MCLVAGTLSGPTPAEARRHHRHQADEAGADGGDDAPGPAGFDYYLLSLSVAPAFCRLSPRNASFPECQALTEDAFERTPLTLHGLWPNRARVSVNRQPQRCGTAPLGDLPAPLQADLRRWMPGGPRLEAHEWQTHGTCSGMTPAEYFAAAVRLAQAMDGTIGSVLREKAAFGTSVRVQDLIGAVSARDPALGAAMVVSCRTPRGGGPTLIEEVRVTLSKALAPVPAGSVGMGQISGCQDGAGVLPRVGG